MKRLIMAYDGLPMVSGVAGGRDKTPAIAGALCGGLAEVRIREQAASLDVMTLRRAA